MSNVNVTYHEMRAAGSRLKEARTDVDGKLSELANMVTSLVSGGFVTDQSSAMFQDSYTEFYEGAKKMLEGLEGMGKYLDSAADTFEQADANLAKTLRS